MRRFVTGLMVLAACAAGCKDEGDDTADASTPVNDGGASGGGLDSGASTAGDGGSKVDAGASDAGAGDAGQGGAKHASVMLVAKSGSTTMGMAVFSHGTDGKVTVTLTVMGATDGKHGVHLHLTGDCSAADASSAGGHWNPEMHMHGDFTDPSTTHLGDLGNIIVTGGTGMLTKTNSEWTLGDGSMTDVIGKALIVHADPDDLVSQGTDGGTPGMSGKRVSCGVVTLSN
jgi:superoxide dismutase, Cu-Zn family